MSNREIEAMRGETTQLALLYINKTPDLYERFLTIRNAKGSAQKNVQICLYAAELWAKENNDEFGALFIAELPLVRWNTILKEL